MFRVLATSYTCRCSSASASTCMDVSLQLICFAGHRVCVSWLEGANGRGAAGVVKMRRGETAKFMLRVNNMRELFAAFAHFAAQLAAKCAARLTQALCIAGQGDACLMSTERVHIMHCSMLMYQLLQHVRVCAQGKKGCVSHTNTQSLDVDSRSLTRDAAHTESLDLAFQILEVEIWCLPQVRAGRRAGS